VFSVFVPEGDLHCSLANGPTRRFDQPLLFGIARRVGWSRVAG
jgi:hypothetical protein